MAGTKDIKDFTKYPSLSDNDYLLGTKTDLGGTDAGITVSSFKKQVSQDVKPEIKNGYWWVLGINTGQSAIGKTTKFRYGPTGLEMKYEDEDDTAYVLIIPLSDLLFTFDKLTPDQILQFKLKFSDLTAAEKLELRGEAFTYDMFTDEQLDKLLLTWDKLTPAQKLEIRGERGYSAFEIWTQREGNADKTEEEYLAWLRQPAVDAAARTDEKMVHISQDVNQVITDTEEAKELALDVANHPTRIDSDCTVEVYDPVGKVYTKTNIKVKGDKGNTMYATFHLNPSTGQLAMHTDSEYKGANFEINNGKLIVTL